MRRALVLLAVLALARTGEAQQRPGPTPLPQGVAHGGLAAQAGSIRLDPKVKAEMQQDAPPRPRAPYLKSGRMRPVQAPRATTPPGRKPARKPAPRPPAAPVPTPRFP